MSDDTAQPDVFSDVIDTTQQSFAERQERVWLYRAKLGRCPQCNDSDLVAGPWGGSSRNVFCTTCHTRWNFHGVTHGIVKVDAGGIADKADADLAAARYPDDQPFTPPRIATLEDVTDNAVQIGAQVKTLLPPNTGLILLVFDHSGNTAMISDVEQKDRMRLMSAAIRRYEYQYPKFIRSLINLVNKALAKA